MSQLTQVLWYCLAVLVIGLAMVGIGGWFRTRRPLAGASRLQRAELPAAADRDRQPA